MRVEIQSRDMIDLTNQLNQTGNMTEEKMKLVKMFVEFLDSGKFGKKMDKHGHHHGHHGKFGRFGKHGHGHHGGHGRHGRHGHHHHHHHGPFHGGPHHGGPHHGGPHNFGRHGHHHGRHGIHGHHGKFKANWVIDLTKNVEDNQCVSDNERNTLLADQNTATTSSDNQQRAMMIKTNCRRHRCGRFGLWMPMPCPLEPNNSTSNDNAPNADVTVAGANIEQSQEQTQGHPQENLTRMVENINIENSD